MPTICARDVTGRGSIRSRTGDDAGDVQQIVHEPALHTRIAVDELEGMDHFAGIELVVLEKRGPGQHGHQWRPQLMRQHGEEHVAGAVRLFGHFTCTPRLGCMQACLGEPGFHTSQQLTRGEGFDDVVIGPGAQTFGRGFLTGPRRKQHDGKLLGRLARADCVQQSEAVHDGHHDIGNDEIRHLLPNAIQGGGAIRRGLNLPAGAQEPAQIAAHIGVVIDYQKARAARMGSVELRQVRSPESSSPAATGSRTGAAMSSGSQPSASSTNGKAPMCVGLRVRTAPMRSAGRWARAARNAQRNSGSDTDLAARFDTATMQFHQFLHQGESDTRALMGACARGTAAKETLEQAGEVFAATPHPVSLTCS